MSRSIWIVAEHQDDNLHTGAAELAGAARSVGDHVAAVVCCEAGSTVPAQAAPFVDQVLVIENAALSGYTAGLWAQGIVGLAKESAPAAILLPHAPLGRDLAPLLAARLDAGLLTDCLELQWEEGLVGLRSVHRRKLVSRERVATPIAIATCQRGAFAASPAGDAAAIETASVAIDDTAARTRLLSMERAEVGEGSITEAEIVVAGGRGLGDAEKFALVQELADAVGGVMGASRPVVDQGWVPHDRQIGSSGVTVRPRLYFALGISGAVQHVVGMRESDVIVAINKDPKAPIFEYAHYGIADDVFKVVPAVIANLNS
ncbi:MAG: electron transfer flavoprotein subunit alpha/FixB family protein [Acidobacteria bacterium]|nr:electron transfer flavoprotein subunit alpha/FixB family protein [Acidobacteriota bacterium]